MADMQTPSPNAPEISSQNVTSTAPNVVPPKVETSASTQPAPAQVQAPVAQAVPPQLLKEIPASVVPQIKVSSDERLWGAISYVPMMALLALIVKGKSDFIKLHARQGLLIFVMFFFSLFIYLFIPPFGPLLAGLIQLLLFAIGIYSAYLAFMGNWWKIPVLGDFATKIPLEMFTTVVTNVVRGQSTNSDSNKNSNS